MALALVTVAIGCGQGVASDNVGGNLRPRERRLVDIGGSTHRPFDDSKVRAVVLVFLVPDCPISDSYIPELNRLHADYEPRGVRLFLVQVDPQLSIEGASEHAREHQLRPPVVRDERHAWVRKVGATITPEAAVLSPAGELLYLGRVDNRYAGLGKRRPQVTLHDLRDSLDAILAGRPVPQPHTKAVGCIIPDIH
ncbi:redoxin domain-containing protein [Singulisphaera sp. GP187]|uniref:redoxin domain-containing protein n=1 Tax=Singulisphaera sp. GP187 TaxID=1882752 RepID=UPI0009416246|nr:redoxin domain-containing protein [Singulisphaera sp. GP187]